MVDRCVSQLANGLRAIAASVLLLVSTHSQCWGDETLFAHDVMAVLSRAGCNLGTCHGNLNGKGDLRLSLRGQDPALDHLALTSHLAGRRINRLEPDQSLILLKPTAEVPHGGGQRFKVGSNEYEILRKWVAAGTSGPSELAPELCELVVSPSEEIISAPEDHTQLQVTAFFTGGMQRDVTSLSVFETSNHLAEVSDDGLVRRAGMGETTVIVRYLQHQVPVRITFLPERRNFAWSDPPSFNFIDDYVHRKLRSMRMNPSELAADHVFVRRVYLDAIGILPTVAETQRFIGSDAAHKRANLIDSLLCRPEFAEHWALKWSDVLRNEEKVLDNRGVEVFHTWIKQSLSEGKPLDDFVSELVTGRGSTYDQPAANYYRANRDAVTRGETTARLFLGTRLQCAKCHNHPFDKWTQDDYYNWAAVFAGN